MQLRGDRLAGHLSQQLAPCYLVAGDEPLLVQEAADQIRAAARAAGCNERERIAIDSKDDWLALHQAGGSLSLFADKRLIEVHIPNGKPGADGSKALQEYLAGEPDDILLIVSGKIDKASQRAKWFTALDQRGVVLLMWPIKLNELPGWIDNRLKQAGLSADRDAVRLLAERVEGNLLAAAQEVEKLKLLAQNQRVTLETVREAVSDNARFNPFDLVDVALAGDARHALRTARGLRAEGSAAPAVLWALHREVRLLSRLHAETQRGASAQQAAQQAGVWRNRVNLVLGALQRHSGASLQRLETLALAVDGASKGFAPGDPWNSIDDMLVLLARGR